MYSITKATIISLSALAAVGLVGAAPIAAVGPSGPAPMAAELEACGPKGDRHGWATNCKCFSTIA
jgi:hypothetical protein